MDLAEIIKKIIDNPDDGNEYAMLGDEYLDEGNVNRAYLCYEYADYLSSGDFKKETAQKMTFCKSSPDFSVHPASFIILSYRIKDIMQECLNAIRNCCIPGSYEVIIVDSSPADDDVRKWLKEQKDITLVLNDRFGGFSAGCNQGVKLAKPDNDIFLLNNDAILTPRAFFYMRLALYGDKKTGAVGPVSANVIEEQLYDTSKRTHDEWLALASSVNQPSLNPIQFAHWLQGHALLIKRSVWDYAGMMDEGFKFGGHEDIEYGIRLNTLGFKLAICKNAFIYHYGSTSLKTVDSLYSEAKRKNEIIFGNKFNFPLEAINESRYYGALSFISAEASAPLNVLMIYGECANFLNLVKYKFPNSNLYAIESNPIYVKIASNYSEAYCMDIEKDALPFENKLFDYVFFCGVERCGDLMSVLSGLKPIMSAKGHLILIAKNANHISVIDALIHGTLNAKLLNGNTRSYTTDDLHNILASCGFGISRLRWTYSSSLANLTESQQQTLDAISTLPNAKDRNTYLHTGTLIDATVPNSSATSNSRFS